MLALKLVLPGRAQEKRAIQRLRLQPGTSRAGSMEDQNCLSELQAFCRGGLPGIARLKQVLPSLFLFYKVSTLAEKERLLTSVGLTPERDGYGDVTFTLSNLDGYQDWLDPAMLSPTLAREGTGPLSP